MSLYKPYPSSSSSSGLPSHTTEFDILKSSHRFLHDDTDGKKDLSWSDQLARKYYESLFREFAVCDLKHYKSGNFALRWRTESEVLSGAGEKTCANTRCPDHEPSSDQLEHPDAPPSIPLTTLELPFAYEEQGETKSALVKVVLCGRCVTKLMWKRNKEKEKEKERMDQEKSRESYGGTKRNMGAALSSAEGNAAGRRRSDGLGRVQDTSPGDKSNHGYLGGEEEGEASRSKKRRGDETGRDGGRPRRRSSRSVSPIRRKSEARSNRHRRSASPRQ
ncbi:uncharacterized protein STEHIDRAFT_165231 [Stereum hirsutum FP-91666 SS1]|uniref:uncharacterized protein n=1 Tax=Stereum hirsutum (strain FP-91666) TaxID=721885 RepID=UPI000440B59E|nr:uncharacterized protein STEHIDRAFT_165231 [Stereum hirsutum FP-91666 SS1]EIM90703.1 hypothetical protein STEHIDRAFT_165231 [Stereum hirsutum FP-91666 SS1]